MTWQESLFNKCKDVNAEPVIANDTLLIVCAEEPPVEFKEAVKYLIPTNTQWEVKIGPKHSTLSNIQTLVSGIHADPATSGIKFNGRVLTATINGVPEDDPFWGRMSDLLRNDGFFKTWVFVINGVIYNIDPKITDELVKNTQLRDKQFTEDDILNLRISLENAQSIDDILKVL